MIAEPSSRRRTLAAAAACPRSGRSAWICGRNEVREPWRAPTERAADDLVGVRLADAACVRAQQPQLQFPGLLLRDRDRYEPPEAGVDAVGVLTAAVHGPLDQLPCRAHLLARLVRQRGAGSIDRH